MTVAPPVFYPEITANEHLEKISGYFGGLERRQADIPDDLRFIFICFTNRSGSNYLAELLCSSQTLPEAGENLNFDSVIGHARQKNLKSFQDYFSFLLRRTQRNGFVAIKIAPGHIELLGRTGILDQIITRSQFILMERSDKLAQAISHLIAFQTGKFMSTMDDGAKHPEFDRAQLDNIITTIADEYRDFNLFFARNGLVPTHMIYEQLVDAPMQRMSYLARQLGIAGLRIEPAGLRLGRQSGDVNEAWKSLYVSRDVVDSEGAQAIAAQPTLIEKV